MFKTNNIKMPITRHSHKYCLSSLLVQTVSMSVMVPLPVTNVNLLTHASIFFINTVRKVAHCNFKKNKKQTKNFSIRMH